MTEPKHERGPQPGSVRVVWTTAPDPGTAARLAQGLVEARLAACVQVVPGARSFYRWQGEVRDEAETLLVAKTDAARVPELEAWLVLHHPYDVPECIAFAPERVEERYGRWLAAEVAPGP